MEIVSKSAIIFPVVTIKVIVASIVVRRVVYLVRSGMIIAMMYATYQNVQTMEVIVNHNYALKAAQKVG